MGSLVVTYRRHGSTVAVVRRPGRRNLYLRYWANGQPVYTSAKTPDLEAAKVLAQTFQTKLQEEPERQPVAPEPVRTEQRKPWIYFIESPVNNLIKIGISVTPYRRFALLQRLSPVPLNLVGLIAGDAETESALHRRFAVSRQHGEWFRGTKTLRAYIAQNSGLPLPQRGAAR